MYKNIRTYVRKHLSKVLDQKVQQLAEVAVQLNEEVLLTNDLSQTLGSCCITRDARESIRVNSLRG